MNEEELVLEVTQALRDQRVEINIKAFELFEALAFIQLALRHPGLPNDQRARVTTIAYKFAHVLEAIGGDAVREIVRRGFDRDYDVPMKEQ